MNTLRKVLLISLVFMFILFSITPNLLAEEIYIKADSYILIDADSGKILKAKNEHKKLAPASMTKLMTLILAMDAIEKEKVSLKEIVITSENAWKMGGSQIYLEPGEKMTYEDLLIAIAVGSANDACVAVGEHLEGTHQKFVDKMNEKCKSMGLKNTHFVNSYGLSAEGHLTTASDMSVIARHALSHPSILEYTNIKEYNLRQGEFKLFNTNKLLWWYEGADGFKTGWTDEAKYCLAATAKRDGLRLIAVVMASPERQGNFRDSMQLFNYGFAQYAFKTFFAKNSPCEVIRVGKGVEDHLEVLAEEDAGAIYLKGEKEELTYKKMIPEYMDAPIQKGQKVGEISIYKDSQLHKKVNVLAGKDVEKAGIMKQILKMFGETFLI